MSQDKNHKNYVTFLEEAVSGLAKISKDYYQYPFSEPITWGEDEERPLSYTTKDSEQLSSIVQKILGSNEVTDIEKKNDDYNEDEDEKNDADINLSEDEEVILKKLLAEVESIDGLDESLTNEDEFLIDSFDGDIADDAIDIDDSDSMLEEDSDFLLEKLINDDEDIEDKIEDKITDEIIKDELKDKLEDEDEDELEDEELEEELEDELEDEELEEELEDELEDEELEEELEDEDEELEDEQEEEDEDY